MLLWELLSTIDAPVHTAIESGVTLGASQARTATTHLRLRAFTFFVASRAAGTFLPHLRDGRALVTSFTISDELPRRLLLPTVHAAKAATTP